MMTYLAQSLILPGSNDPIAVPSLNPAFNSPASVLNEAAPIVLTIAGLLLFGYFIWGGFEFLTAMGDPEKAAAGRARITYAVVGFVVVFAAYWLTQVFSYLFAGSAGLGIF